MKTVVFAMTHLRGQNEGALLRIWQSMLVPQNYDLLLVDSASPLPINEFLIGDWTHTIIPDDDAEMMVYGPRNVLLFKDSRGHPFGMACARLPAPTVQ